MATLERYSSFEEMDNAPQKQSGKKKAGRKKKLTTIAEFAALLRENVVAKPSPGKPSPTK